MVISCCTPALGTVPLCPEQDVSQRVKNKELFPRSYCFNDKINKMSEYTYHSAVNQFLYYCFNFNSDHLMETVAQIAEAEGCSTDHIYNNYLMDNGSPLVSREKLIQLYTSIGSKARIAFIDRAVQYYESNENPDYRMRLNPS